MITTSSVPGRWLKCVFLAALRIGIAASALAQVAVAQNNPLRAGGTLQLTTTSAEARIAFLRAWDEGNRGNRPAAALLAARAVQLDPNFGLARVFHSRLVPGPLGTRELGIELERGVSDATRSSVAEGLLATAIKTTYEAAFPSIFPSATPPNYGLLAGQALFTFSSRRRVARSLLDSLVLLVPNDPHVAYFRSTIVDINEFDALLLAIAQRFPDFPIVHHTLGMRRRIAGDLPGAEKHLLDYLRLAPALAHSHYSYGALLSDARRFNEALSHHREALRLDSTSALYWEATSLAFSGIGSYPEAVQHARRAIEIEPTATRRLDVLSAIHLRAGRGDLAVQELRSAIARDSMYLDGYSSMARVYLQMAQFDDAVRAFREHAARSTTPVAFMPPARNGALTHVIAGRPLDAIAALDSVIAVMLRLDPRGGTATLDRDKALIYAAIGDGPRVRSLLAEDSVIVASSQFERNANTTPVLSSLALCFALVGSKADASKYVALLRTGAQQNPAPVTTQTPQQSAQFHEAMAVIAAVEGDVDSARSHVEQAGEGALLGRAMLAEALKKLGREADVKMLKEQILRTPPPLILTATYAIALSKARGL